MEIAAAAVDRERDRHQLRDPGENDVVGCEMTAPLAGFFVLWGLAVLGAGGLVFQNQSTSLSGEQSSTLWISNMIFREFVYPFELTSFLILVAVLGATVLAQREKS